ncbi:MAG: SHOCT domain-containing protein [Magnetovibrio sp.]|nr:SHOCT domain-containing protein [Magnetovibrio sp.]
MWNGSYNSHMMGFGDGGWWLPMGLHGLFVLLIVGLIIYGVVLAVRSFSYAGPGAHALPSNPALDALGARYAAGEIEREEYIAKKRDLQD